MFETGIFSNGSTKYCQFSTEKLHIYPLINNKLLQITTYDRALARKKMCFTWIGNRMQVGAL